MRKNRESEEVRKARDLNRIEGLAGQFGLSLAEYVIVHLVYYEDRPIDQVVKFALALWGGGYGFPLLPRHEYDQALSNLLERKLIQLIDERSLASIRELLERDPAIGPTNGLPRIGTVHFTFDGLAIWQQMQRIQDDQRGRIRFYGTTAPIYNGNQCTIYSNYICQAYRVARDLGANKIGLPTPIGPWRCHWWEKYPAGFKLECTIAQPEASSK